MKNRWTLSLKIIVPLLSVVVCLLFLELAARLVMRSPAKWTLEQNDRLLAGAEKLYPPSRPLFALIDSERPALEPTPAMQQGVRPRDYEYPVPKPADRYRIVGLGDSFAWGWGVNDNRRTIFKLLECWLNHEKRDRKIEVLNRAMPGASAHYYDVFMNPTGFDLQPDMVLIVFNINDAEAFHSTVPFDTWAKMRMARETDWLSKVSRLYEFIKLRFIQKQVRDWTIADYHDSYFGSKKKERWLAAQQKMKRVIESCRQRGIALVVAVFPLLSDLEKKEYLFAAEMEAIVSFFRNNQVPCLNLLPDFIGKKSNLLWIFPDNAHPNEIAQRIAAESIYRYLTSADLLPPQSR